MEGAAGLSHDASRADLIARASTAFPSGVTASLPIPPPKQMIMDVELDAMIDAHIEELPSDADEKGHHRRGGLTKDEDDEWIHTDMDEARSHAAALRTSGCATLLRLKAGQSLPQARS